MLKSAKQSEAKKGGVINPQNYNFNQLNMDNFDALKPLRINPVSKWDLLLATCNDISVIYVTIHSCAGGLKKKFTYGRATNAKDIS